MWTVKVKEKIEFMDWVPGEDENGEYYIIRVDRGHGIIPMCRLYPDTRRIVDLGLNINYTVTWG